LFEAQCIALERAETFLLNKIKVLPTRCAELRAALACETIIIAWLADLLLPFEAFDRDIRRARVCAVVCILREI
jgi:hypothetical protein